MLFKILCKAQTKMAGERPPASSDSEFWRLRGERAAAAAIPRRIGILENESLAHQCLLVLQGRAVQVKKTFRVDKDARAKLLENLVPVARLGVQAHGIRKSGTA